MNAEFEAFLNNEVGKMYANDTQQLMLYRVLSMLCKEIMDMVEDWKENNG